MESKPMDYSSAKPKLMEAVSSATVEISQERFQSILEVNQQNEYYARYYRAATDAERRVRQSVMDANRALADLSKLRARNDQREGFLHKIKAGTATHEEKVMYENSSCLAAEIDALSRKELNLSQDTEKFYEKLERAKEQLKRFSLEKFSMHIFEENGKFFKLGGGTNFLLQPWKEDERTVGSLWVQFFLRDCDFRTFTREDILPLVERYIAAIDDSNVDKASVLRVQILLKENPLASRWTVLEHVRDTLGEETRQMFLDKVNNLARIPEAKADMDFSIDPQKCLQQKITARKSDYHEDTTLIRETAYIYESMSAKDKKLVGIPYHKLKPYLRSERHEPYKKKGKGQQQQKQQQKQDGPQTSKPAQSGKEQEKKPFFKKKNKQQEGKKEQQKGQQSQQK